MYIEVVAILVGLTVQAGVDRSLVEGSCPARESAASRRIVTSVALSRGYEDTRARHALTGDLASIRFLSAPDDVYACKQLNTVVEALRRRATTPLTVTYYSVGPYYFVLLEPERTSPVSTRWKTLLILNGDFDQIVAIGV